jgi:hypothetical protein
MQYQLILQLRIQHEYFPVGNCAALHIVPSEYTAQLIESYQLLLKPFAGGFYLLANSERNFAIAAPWVLSFNIYTNDAYFNNYTHSESNQAIFWYYIKNPLGTAEQQQACAYLDDNNDRQLSGRKPKGPAPTMKLDLDFDAEEIDRSMQPKELIIQIPARKLHWKYYFFGDLATADIHIEDLNTQVPINFLRCDEVVVNGGAAFISEVPLPMSANPTQRFQLKDKTGFGKVLIKRLPNAGVQLIGKGRNSSGQSVLVAEIYINQ